MRTIEILLVCFHHECNSHPDFWYFFLNKKICPRTSFSCTLLSNGTDSFPLRSCHTYWYISTTFHHSFLSYHLSASNHLSTCVFRFVSYPRKSFYVHGYASEITRERTMFFFILSSFFLSLASVFFDRERYDPPCDR